MHVIVYDFGTTSVKTCLFKVDDAIEIVASDIASYGLYTNERGSAEQNAEEWWEAVCSTTRNLFEISDVEPGQVEGISFVSQMQGTVLIDEEGRVLRPPMNFLDNKGEDECRKHMGKGLIKIAGCNAFKLLRNLHVNKAGPLSGKDPLWKYKWVETHEPEVFKKVYKWLDVGDYLLYCCTGKIVRTPDTAFATFLYDTRKGKEGWNKGLLKMYKVNPEHLPEIIDNTEVVGGLLPEAAKEMGLLEGIPVFAGGGDVTFVNIGAGSSEVGDTHIYIGTSGWVSTFLDHQVVDPIKMMASVLSCKNGYFNLYAELETAGKCYEWALGNLVLDEIGIYIDDPNSNFESMCINIYDYIASRIEKVPPGANGVIFTPWMQGNRCPFEDDKAGGMFFNLNIKNKKVDMIRAVLEGICYHMRWMLEGQDKKVKTSNTIRFVGGGALSPVVCQMMADITGRTIETVNNTQEVGAIGAAILVAAGIKGEDVFELSKQYVKVKQSYEPNPANREVYQRQYNVFNKLYKNNKKSFHQVNVDS